MSSDLRTDCPEATAQHGDQGTRISPDGNLPPASATFNGYSDPLDRSIHIVGTRTKQNECVNGTSLHVRLGLHGLAPFDLFKAVRMPVVNTPNIFVADCPETIAQCGDQGTRNSLMKHSRRCPAAIRDYPNR